MNRSRRLRVPAFLRIPQRCCSGDSGTGTKACWRATNGDCVILTPEEIIADPG